jgi:hypothetical protein
MIPLYFDLDNTFVKDNPIISKSLNAVRIFLTNRNRNEIKFPKLYSFDEIVGKDNMEEYIDKYILGHKVKHFRATKIV